MDKIELYLSGAISELEQDGRVWRDLLKEEHPEYHYEDPLDYHDPQDDVRIRFPETVQENFPEETHWVNFSDVVNEDKRLIRKSDIVFANFESDIESTGTDMEVLYAYLRDTPVVVWSDSPVEDMPLWWREHSSYISTDIENCLAFAEGVDTE